ncbi:MAG: F0F1 ATP synthase subunit gamma, partial [Rhodospirillales bacterium]|nr:F0F1 ATP synthase subunit gamma [Rhodospirillales bacterium]
GGLGFDKAAELSERIFQMYEAGEFDVCTVIYNRFQSAMTQHVTPRQVIPFVADDSAADEDEAAAGSGAMYILEPEESEILDALLPRNLAVQIHHALTESYASEQGARMTAMDSATRNAGDMIDRLTLTYNRTRQAVITKELIEIVSGAEAL